MQKSVWDRDYQIPDLTAFVIVGNVKNVRPGMYVGPDMGMSSAICKYGSSCNREDCTFGHPYEGEESRRFHVSEPRRSQGRSLSEHQENSIGTGPISTYSSGPRAVTHSGSFASMDHQPDESGRNIDNDFGVYQEHASSYSPEMNGQRRDSNYSNGNGMSKRPLPNSAAGGSYGSASSNNSHSSRRGFPSHPSQLNSNAIFVTETA